MPDDARLMKNKAVTVARLLDEHYPADTKCFLRHEQPHELLVATILSAQCTDDMVNKVTPALFEKYRTIDAFARADVDELKHFIHSTGFYNIKAKNIIAAMTMLRDDFGGIMPSEIEKLIKMPGVGRKTANVVRGHIFGIPSIVVDTHVGRISRKLGLTTHEDPEKAEYDLMNLLPEEYWIKINTQLITHGRRVCKAQRPACRECFLRDLCGYINDD